MLLNCGAGEDSWESLGLQEIQPLHPKGDQSWVFIGRIDVEAETPILWPLDAESWLIWKDPDAGKDWGPEEKGMTEDEMVGWHHWHNGHGFGWTPGVGDGQGGLASCDSWGHKESDTTERLNLTELIVQNYDATSFSKWKQCNLSSICLVAKSYLTLCNPVDCSPSDSSVHGIFQSRILECVAIVFSTGSSQTREWTCVSCIDGRFFTTELPGKLKGVVANS